MGENAKIVSRGGDSKAPLRLLRLTAVPMAKDGIVPLCGAADTPASPASHNVQSCGRSAVRTHQN